METIPRKAVIQSHQFNGSEVEASERMLLQVDPHLSRTVVVSTKLDTRLPQFARGQDVDMFLHPAGRLLEPGMLGGCPFYT